MKVNRQRLSVGSFFYTIETSIHKQVLEVCQ